ncbi:MAG: aspartate kinase [Eubacteriales bacterium]|nr:aspartate kinase [Eubacteriales bacterium]
MGLKVLKFGGSSVADGIQLGKIKEIVEQDRDRRYVVVSAPGKRFDGDSKITDLLYMCKTQYDHHIPCDQLFQVIADRYNAVAYNLKVDVDLESHFREIREEMEKGCSVDYVVSRGEYLSAVLVAAYLGYDFVDTKDLILFDSRGRLLGEETNEAIRQELARHERAVLPGFYGSRKDTGKVQVFSRGGSDITGSLVARAMDADIYENWTDVSGLLMADPRIVKNPKPIDRISYIELRELSYMGASVLHEDAVFPVRKADIPINIRNTNAPEDPGTIITGDTESLGDKVISGIAGKKNFTIITVYKNMMNKEIGFVRRALMILEDFHINFEHMPTGIDSVSMVIESKELEDKLEDVLEAFRVQLSPDDVTVDSDMAMIAVVGLGMARRVGTAARIIDTMRDQGINIRMLIQGTSEINTMLGVENQDFEKAMQSIYHEFEPEE